jgi:pyruvate/2-oxoglutarate dehydrogenase complex dihydrolipoamide dehydrogenase (E3) component
MSSVLETDLCIIGAGSAGLSVAAGVAQLGRPVILIERHKMGGDCLNSGCVPSKALLAAAHAAQAVRQARIFGVEAGDPVVDFAKVHAHVHGVIATIAPHDSVERFTGLGVHVISAQARFTAPDMVETDRGDRIRARRFVIAAGSRPAIPAVPGLEGIDYLTNESVFDMTRLPRRLLIMGGGPIGLEMAQAHARLGAEVTVVQRSRILPKDDPELAGVVRSALMGEGIRLLEHASVQSARRRVGPDGETVVLAVRDSAGNMQDIEGERLFIAVGRQPNLEGLGLDAAGVAYDERGVKTDAGLRSTNRRIFALGDISGGPQFTHVAGYHAGVFIQRALFRLPAKVDYKALPWVTYTDPELAQVGLTEAAAKERYGDIQVVRWPFHDNDRAQTGRQTEGLVKAVLRKNGLIVGAGIVGPSAGELIQSWGLAIANGLKISAFTRMIAPYPTLGEASKRAAGAFFTPRLFSERTKRLVAFLARFG